MDRLQFLAKVRRRRNQHWLWWLAAPIPFFSARWLLDLLPKSVFVFDASAIFALLAWFGIWLWLGERLCGLRCIYCGKRAFGYRPFVFTSNLKCASCGRSFTQE